MIGIESGEFGEDGFAFGHAFGGIVLSVSFVPSFTAFEVGVIVLDDDVARINDDAVIVGHHGVIVIAVNRLEARMQEMILLFVAGTRDDAEAEEVVGAVAIADMQRGGLSDLTCEGFEDKRIPMHRWNEIVVELHEDVTGAGLCSGVPGADAGTTAIHRHDMTIETQGIAGFVIDTDADATTDVAAAAALLQHKSGSFANKLKNIFYSGSAKERTFRVGTKSKFWAVPNMQSQRDPARG